MFFDRTKQIAALRKERDELKARVRQLEKVGRKSSGPPGVPLQELEYNADGLSVWGKNLDFLKEELFERAYEKGARSGHRFAKDADQFHIEWRVHTVLWAAGLGLRLDGDFVECGVNTGIFSLAIAEYHHFASSGRKFYLFDTFCGTPEEQMDAAEREKRLRDNEMYYPDCYELAESNFAPYPNMHLIRGRVPESLSDSGVQKVAYLSIDMNVAEAERAAIEFFWDRLVPGAPVVLDDYAWAGCESQKAAMDEFAKLVGTSVLTMPTGQGLMFKV